MKIKINAIDRWISITRRGHHQHIFIISISDGRKPISFKMATNKTHINNIRAVTNRIINRLNNRIDIPSPTAV